MSEPSDRWSVSLAGATLLRRYRVDRTIGAGGMANVYLAHDEQLDLPVVVKVPHAAFLAEPGFRERFDRETRDLVTLQHPHIVRILGRGEHEDLPFLVMQFLQGGSLGKRMRDAKGPMPFDAVAPWLRDIGRALDFIHDRGIVHRDIKPDNVLFDDHGHAYLSDFGIAKAVGGADTGLTMTGATPGSPQYMAPEQARTNALNGRSDQYSFAATLYEALAGRPTFEGETVVDVLLKKQSEVPTPLDSVAPDVPAPAAAAIMRALAREPDARFESCRAFVAAMLAPGAAPAAEPVPAAVPAPVPVVPEPTTVLPRRAPVHPPEPAATRSVGRTATLGGAQRALWIAFALLLAVPLALVLMPGGPEGPADMTTADGGAAPPIVDRRPPPPAVPKEAAATPDLAGTYELDLDATQERIRALRERRPKMPRAAGTWEDLERVAKGGMQLVLRDDGTFTMVPPPRPGKPARPIDGTWAVHADTVTLEAKGEDAARIGKRGTGTFRLRVREEGGLLFHFGKLGLPLRRR